MNNKCILWDFDNTLAYRDGKWTKSLCNVLVNNGYNEFNHESISNTFKTGFPWHRYEEAHSDYFNNMSWWEYVNTLISKAIFAVGIIDAEENKRLTNQFKKEYMRIDSWSLYDDTIRNLEYSISLGYKNVILSNHIPELELLGEGLGITKYFESVITSAKVGYEKPNRKIFEEVFKLSRNDEYYMIGDNYSADVVGGINSGFNSILVRKENTMNYNKYSKDLDGIWEFID